MLSSWGKHIASLEPVVLPMAVSIVTRNAVQFSNAAQGISQEAMSALRSVGGLAAVLSGLLSTFSEPLASRAARISSLIDDVLDIIADAQVTSGAPEADLKRVEQLLRIADPSPFEDAAQALSLIRFLFDEVSNCGARC